MDTATMNQRDEFNKQLDAIVATKSRNHVYMTKETYEKILKEVSIAKVKTNTKTALDYRRLQRYDTIIIGEETKLILPGRENNGLTNIKFFVTIQELFDVIHNAHLSIGHGGRDRLVKELGEKYKNVTVEAIMVYLNLCDICKHKGQRKRLVTPVNVNEADLRCHVNLIEMPQPDDKFKFILSYQDHRSKFLVLRALETKKSSEIADHIIDIFTLFGVPSILQSELGPEFVQNIIAAVTNLWYGIHIVNGRDGNSQQPGSIQQANQDIQNMLLTWLFTNKSTKWSRGIQFVQMMRNTAYDDDIKQTPYDALFGGNMKLGFPTFDPSEEFVPEVQLEHTFTDSGNNMNFIKEETTIDISGNYMFEATNFEFDCDDSEETIPTVQRNRIITDPNETDFKLENIKNIVTKKFDSVHNISGTEDNSANSVHNISGTEDNSANPVRLLNSGEMNSFINHEPITEKDDIFEMMYKGQFKPLLPTDAWGQHLGLLPKRSIIFSQIANRMQESREPPSFTKQIIFNEQHTIQLFILDTLQNICFEWPETIKDIEIILYSVNKIILSCAGPGTTTFKKPLPRCANTDSTDRRRQSLRNFRINSGVKWKKCASLYNLLQQRTQQLRNIMTKYMIKTHSGKNTLNNIRNVARIQTKSLNRVRNELGRLKTKVFTLEKKLEEITRIDL